VKTCHVCGTELADDAVYCHKCGRRVRAADARENIWSVAVPWAAAGAAVGALVTLLVLRGSAPATPASTPLPLSGGASDISQMSPEERATRLFNRVMRLDEEGKADSVTFFAPMALQSYEMLPARDADARYHMALLELAAGNPRGAAAQADSIARLAPDHLFGFVIRARIAHARGDAAGERRALQDFRSRERAERARARPEYQDHATQLDAISREAARATP
jgi:hypothetical protein